MEIDGRSIPNTLRKHRRSWGYSQRQVADMLGMVSTNKISQWEHGLSAPTLKHVIRLSLIYETRIEDLYFPLLQEMRADFEEEQNMKI